MKVKYEELIWPIGKFKGQPLKDVIKNESYMNWLMQQEFLKGDYPELYEVLVNPQSEYKKLPYNKSTGKKPQSSRKAKRKTKHTANQIEERKLSRRLGNANAQLGRNMNKKPDGDLFRVLMSYPIYLN